MLSLSAMYHTIKRHFLTQCYQASVWIYCNWSGNKSRVFKPQWLTQDTANLQTSWKQFKTEASAPTGSTIRIKILMQYYCSIRSQALLVASLMWWRLQVWAGTVRPDSLTEFHHKNGMAVLLTPELQLLRNAATIIKKTYFEKDHASNQKKNFGRLHTVVFNMNTCSTCITWW
jgi:hypothetical protein